MKILKSKRFMSAAFMLFIADLLCMLVFGGCFRKNGSGAENEKNKGGEVQDGTDRAEPKGITVCIDPGHGGVDPGKVGVNNALEKDINLAISLMLREQLEAAGYDVIMTRETDAGLYDEGEKSKKMADLKRRIALIEEKKPDIVVGIHQNSFTQESSKGAQVFYYKESQDGATLAGIMQEQLRSELADGNSRQAKANDNYYMLVHTSAPMIIVECGFLSNNEEAEKLMTAEYQQKLAEIIAHGVDAFFG